MNLKEKPTLLFLLILLLFPANRICSQEASRWMTGIEAGTDFTACDEPNKAFIRGDRTLYGSGNAQASMKGLMSRNYLGIRRDLFIKNRRFALSGGLRYTKRSSSLGKDSYWAENSQYFFVLYRQDGLTTQYLRLRSFDETCHYLGIPLEVKLFPYQTEGKRIYFKAGTEFNYLLKSKIHASFYEPAMKIYAAEIEKMPGKTPVFESRVYSAVGISFLPASGAAVNLEVILPMIYLSKNNSSLVKPVSGAGLQCSILLPY